MKKRRIGRRSRRGLTLIDVMVTVTIIALFTGIAAVTANNIWQQSQIDAATVEVSNLADAVTMYSIKHRRFPTTGEGLTKLIEGDVMERIPNDPWGNAYIYLSPGQTHPKTFDLYSIGPDAVEHTEDDIVR